MVALFCDRCGEKISAGLDYNKHRYKVSIYFDKLNSDIPECNKDLCGKCKKELRDWLGPIPKDGNDEEIIQKPVGV